MHIFISALLLPSSHSWHICMQTGYSRKTTIKNTWLNCLSIYPHISTTTTKRHCFVATIVICTIFLLHQLLPYVVPSNCILFKWNQLIFFIILHHPVTPYPGHRTFSFNKLNFRNYTFKWKFKHLQNLHFNKHGRFISSVFFFFCFAVDGFSKLNFVNLMKL